MEVSGELDPFLPLPSPSLEVREADAVETNAVPIAYSIREEEAVDSDWMLDALLPLTITETQQPRRIPERVSKLLAKIQKVVFDFKRVRFDATAPTRPYRNRRVPLDALGTSPMQSIAMEFATIADDASFHALLTLNTKFSNGMSSLERIRQGLHESGHKISDSPDADLLELEQQKLTFLIERLFKPLEQELAYITTSTTSNVWTVWGELRQLVLQPRTVEFTEHVVALESQQQQSQVGEEILVRLYASRIMNMLQTLELSAVMIPTTTTTMALHTDDTKTEEAERMLARDRNLPDKTHMTDTMKQRIQQPDAYRSELIDCCELGMEHVCALYVLQKMLQGILPVLGATPTFALFLDVQRYSEYIAMSRNEAHNTLTRFMRTTDEVAQVFEEHSPLQVPGIVYYCLLDEPFRERSISCLLMNQFLTSASIAACFPLGARAIPYMVQVPELLRDSVIGNRQTDVLVAALLCAMPTTEQTYALHRVLRIGRRDEQGSSFIDRVVRIQVSANWNSARSLAEYRLVLQEASSSAATASRSWEKELPKYWIGMNSTEVGYRHGMNHTKSEDVAEYYERCVTACHELNREHGLDLCVRSRLLSRLTTDLCLRWRSAAVPAVVLEAPTGGAESLAAFEIPPWLRMTMKFRATRRAPEYMCSWMRLCPPHKTRLFWQLFTISLDHLQLLTGACDLFGSFGTTTPTNSPAVFLPTNLYELGLVLRLKPNPTEWRQLILSMEDEWPSVFTETPSRVLERLKDIVMARLCRRFYSEYPECLRFLFPGEFTASGLEPEEFVTRYRDRFPAATKAESPLLQEMVNMPEEFGPHYAKTLLVRLIAEVHTVEQLLQFCSRLISVLRTTTNNTDGEPFRTTITTVLQSQQQRPLQVWRQVMAGFTSETALKHMLRLSPDDSWLPSVSTLPDLTSVEDELDTETTATFASAQHVQVWSRTWGLRASVSEIDGKNDQVNLHERDVDWMPIPPHKQVLLPSEDTFHLWSDTTARVSSGLVITSDGTQVDMSAAEYGTPPGTRVAYLSTLVSIDSHNVMRLPSHEDGTLHTREMFIRGWRAPSEIEIYYGQANRCVPTNQCALVWMGDLHHHHHHRQQQQQKHTPAKWNLLKLNDVTEENSFPRVVLCTDKIALDPVRFHFGFSKLEVEQHGLSPVLAHVLFAVTLVMDATGRREWDEFRSFMETELEGRVTDSDETCAIRLCKSLVVACRGTNDATGEERKRTRTEWIAYMRERKFFAREMVETLRRYLCRGAWVSEGPRTRSAGISTSRHNSQVRSDAGTGFVSLIGVAVTCYWKIGED